jgi:lipopolysaccharide/colanic/teichoic acid biosynthesis glycosyltransferase
MYRYFIKPVLDFSLGILMSIITLPIILILMVLIRLESKGSPIFTQMRVGKNGKLFKMYKLRSMYLQKSPNSSFSTEMNDPRITKLGKFIRKTSLDELPQLWNLVLGNMSLIGPRPDVLQQKDQYREEDWSLRLSAKPGITGLAQSTLRSLATPDQRLLLDLKYVKEISFWIDLQILIKTFLIVLKKRNSN